jgi:hypothetical protein
MIMRSLSSSKRDRDPESSVFDFWVVDLICWTGHGWNKRMISIKEKISTPTPPPPDVVYTELLGGHYHGSSHQHRHHDPLEGRQRHSRPRPPSLPSGCSGSSSAPAALSAAHQVQLAAPSPPAFPSVFRAPRIPGILRPLRARRPSMTARPPQFLLGGIASQQRQDMFFFHDADMVVRSGNSTTSVFRFVYSQTHPAEAGEG